MATSRAFVALRDSAVDLDVDAPTLNDFVRAQCKTKLDSMRLLAAQVVWPDDKVASFADAKLSQASNVMVDDDGFHPLQGPPEWASIWHGETGVTGRFYVCDIPRRALLRLDVEHDGATVRWEFSTSDRGRLVYANRLVLTPKPR